MAEDIFSLSDLESEHGGGAEDARVDEDVEMS